jgi:hypothetical protein
MRIAAQPSSFRFHNVGAKREIERRHDIEVARI